MVNVLSFIVSTNGVIFACGGIVLFALISAAFFTKRVDPISRTLQRAIKKLSESKNELAFVDSYYDFDEWMSKSKILAMSWSEFTETLILPTDNEEPIRNTHPADDYFNDESLLYPHVNVRFYNNLSNLLSGMGILGTFIGLVAGIYIALGQVLTPEQTRSYLPQDGYDQESDQ